MTHAENHRHNIILFLNKFIMPNFDLFHYCSQMILISFITGHISNSELTKAIFQVVFDMFWRFSIATSFIALIGLLLLMRPVINGLEKYWKILKIHEKTLK